MKAAISLTGHMPIVSCYFEIRTGIWWLRKCKNTESNFTTLFGEHSMIDSEEICNGNTKFKPFSKKSMEEEHCSVVLSRSFVRTRDKEEEETSE